MNTLALIAIGFGLGQFVACRQWSKVVDDYDALCERLLKDKERLLLEKRRAWDRPIEEADWWKPSGWTPETDE